MRPVLLGIAVCLAAAQAQDWAALDRQAEALYARGDLKEAIGAAKLAVAAASGSGQSGHSLDRLGFFEYTAGDVKNGETHLRQALDIRKNSSGADTAEYAESANDLALLCRDTARLPEAKELAGQAVAIRTRALGPRHLRVAESLNTLASVLGLMGDYDGAIARFEEARSIHESQPEPRDFAEEYGTLCINLAGTYQRVGKYAKAESAFETGLDVLRKKPGVNHPAYSASLVAYAYLQAELGHYAAAEKLYDEGGKLLREQLGEQHPVYATFLNNRAALYTALGNLTVAESDHRKALALKRRLYGADALTVGASLRNLARLVYVRNRAEGEQLFQQAVDLYRKNPKAPPFDYTSALLGLAEAQRNRGDLPAARATLQLASEVASKGLGTKHPLYAAVLRDLGLVHQSAREYVEAERQLQAAIAIVSETQGENHPDLAGYFQRLAAVYDEAGDYAAAEPFYRRSLQIGDRTLVDMLAIGSQKNKAAALANTDDPVPALIAFQQRAGERVPSARALAFEAVAGRKGRVLDQVHDWGQTLRQNSDRAIRDRFRQWENMLECEASLTVALGYHDLKPAVQGTCDLTGSELDGRYGRLLHDLRTNWTEALGREGLAAVKTLRGRIELVEAGLSREMPRFASTTRPTRLEEIRARLQPDEALVEFVAWQDRNAVASYGAFLLGAAGEVEWRDLGPARPIDRAVQDLIAAANDWSASLAGRQNREAAAEEETAADALRALSRKLGPVVAWVAARNNVRRLRVAPDGMLNLVPFGALSDAHGHFLVERFALSYLSAGRDLIEPAAPTGNAGPAIVALSPGSRAHGAGPALDPLAGADAEAREVQRWIPRAQLLGMSEATEERIKKLHRPSLLHIVGHGIVRGKEDCGADRANPACELSGINPAERVMSLSAIVLEEAYGRGGASPQDGMLTALELQTLDLEGTEMLVLSECRMADGVPSSGEGVYGMRRAAAIAGVKTFVAPLWKVEDSAQQALMDRFYHELSAETGRAEALRRAQVQLLRSPRTASFLQWAPIILSGDPDPLPPRLFGLRR